MLAFIFRRAVNVDSIPDGIFPKRQVVGTAVTTIGTTITSSIIASTTVMSSSSAPAVVSSTTTPIPSSTPITSSSPPVVQSSTTIPVVSSTTTSRTVAPPASSTPAAPSSTTPRSTPTSTSTSSNVLASTMSGSDLVVVGSSTINRSALSGATTITSALIGSETEAVESTSYWTSNGQVYSTVYTSNRVVSSTTGFATATIDPLLASNQASSGNSLSPQSQAIIGGVVGGVGGAILLGGLAFAFWRIRGRKNREKLPQDDYYDGKFGTVATEENTDGLERYRTNGAPTTAPATSVNASSNF